MSNNEEEEKDKVLNAVQKLYIIFENG